MNIRFEEELNPIKTTELIESGRLLEDYWRPVEIYCHPVKNTLLEQI